MFLIWLSEQITQRGIGNGLALILCAGIVMDFAAETAATVELHRTGALSDGGLFGLVVLTVCFVACIVFVERGRRRLPLAFASKQVGDRVLPARQSELVLKLNNAGYFPAIVAPWFFYLPLEHSEDVADQRASLAYFSGFDANTFTYARSHARMIARFGRFPHRNAALGRKARRRSWPR